MKKTVLFVSCVVLIALLSGCREDKLEKLLKQYPKEMVEAFYATGMLIAEPYDENKIILEKTSAFKTEKEFFINPIPQVDTQYANECGGMSSAYVMRFYGKQATGLEIYNQIADKNIDGTISPRPLKNFWNSQVDFNLYACKGNIESLKNAVSHNIPVIVLINCPGGWHYVPVIGFDEKYIYIQDSVPDFRNVSGEIYNRKETYESFEKLWSVILPESDHLMYVVTQK